MRLPRRRHRPNLRRALAEMAAADAYCGEHGHNWQRTETRFKLICARCGDTRTQTTADVEREINDWNAHAIRHHLNKHP